MNILKHEFKSNIISLIIWSGALLMIVGLVSFEFAVFQGNAEIQALMENEVFESFFTALGVKAINMTTPEGFLSILSIYFYVPLAIFSGLLGAKIISKEEKDKTAEYLFTLPVSRQRVLLFKFISGLIQVMILNLIVLLGAMLIFSRFDRSDYYFNFIFNMMIGVFATQMIFYSIGLGLASYLRDYKKSGSYTISILIATYMISVLSNMVTEANFLRFFTPFRYFESGAMLEGKFYIEYILITIMVASLGIYSLFTFYKKRDLYI